MHRGSERSTTDKAKIIEQLNRSFGYALAAAQKMSNSDLAKAEKELGPGRERWRRDLRPGYKESRASGAIDRLCPHERSDATVDGRNAKEKRQASCRIEMYVSPMFSAGD
jgi:hypothetical protein